jgi:integrating conjugative element protein (TIGR03761 family)
MSASRPLVDSTPDHPHTEADMTAQEAPSSLGPVADSDPTMAARVAPAKTAGPALGQLVDKTPDAMTLHTQDAYRMFTGRAADPASNAPAIPGGRRFAAVLKAIWYLSANDNPYADWILIRVYQSLSGIRAQMGQVIHAREAEFERLSRRGLALSVLASRSPVTVELGFRSPYGYATAEAIVEFDYHVRMVKTLVLKDRMSDEAGRAEIRTIGRGLRALFLEPIRWERNLLREEMLALSRRDFLPGADDTARQRVRAAVALFGELPRKVFTGEEAPRHSQRRVTPTAAELRLMQQVSLGADAELPEAPKGQLL